MKLYTSIKEIKNYVEKSWQMGKVISSAYTKTLVNKNKNKYGPRKSAVNRLNSLVNINFYHEFVYPTTLTDVSPVCVLWFFKKNYIKTI